MKKKQTSKRIKASNNDDIRAEYDFSAGVRGKHYKSRLNGYTIRIHKKDGSAEVREIEPNGSVVLEPDVQEYFPDSRAVNRALRTLSRSFREREPPTSRVRHKRNQKRLRPSDRPEGRA